jgi:signal transduction histidine kinase
MASRHSVLITGAPLRIGVHAHCFASRDSDTVPVPLVRPRTKVAAKKPFRSTGHRQLILEDAIRLEERCRERAHIVRELHDTVLQGFLGASMLLHHAMEQHVPTHLLSPLSAALCAWCVGRSMKAARLIRGFK